MDKKIVVLGDSGVGKTALVYRFVKGTFSEDYRPTSGAVPFKKEIELDGKKHKLVIWDVAGHTLKLHPAFTSEAHGAILVCDLSKQMSIESLIAWHDIITRKVGKIPIIVAATKNDIADMHECAALKDAGYIIVKTSAKTGENVNQVFNEVISRL